MAYFPFFADLQGCEILICGSGPKALEKESRLSPFGPHLRRIDHFDPSLLEERPALVIAAEEDREANRRTAACCRALHIPVNAVDDKDFCDFIFPAVLVTDKLTAGISTGGASPTAAVMICDRLADLLGEHIDEILCQLEALRPHMAAEISEPDRRKALWRNLFSRALELDRPLTEDEITAILSNHTT